jgi:hypothetical protein
MGDGVARRRASGGKSVKILCIHLVAVFAAMTVMAMGFGSGVASAADPLIGKKYSDAASWISRRNGTPVVATVSGSQLALDDCIVISWSKGGFRNSRGKNDRRNHYFVHLNCNNAVATPGHPGNSLMTPEGKKRKAQLDRAQQINDKPERCKRSQAAYESCVRFCNSTGLCKVEL